MIGIENKDSSFFTVESPDVSVDGTDFEKSLKSLKISEKMGAMPTGQLTFNDPNHIYSRILRTGVTLNISWGYKDLNITPDSLIAKRLNLDEVSGSLIRRGYQGFVSSPTGGGSDRGEVTYNCNFTAFGFRGEEQSIVYTAGTKKTVVQAAFAQIGILQSVIDFTLGNDAITPDKYVRQDETSFAFLSRLAIEWRAVFYVAFNPAGLPIGFFIDVNKIGTVPLPEWALGASGGSHAIGYKGELNNVKSYKWTSSESESGVGDNVRLDIIDGNIVFRRYVATEEKVITYRLNQEKLQAVYQEASDIGTQVALTKELLSAKDFESIKHFFTAVEQTTAPQGFGYRINAEMIGNPLFIPGNIIKVNNGFPDRLGGSQSKWYLHGVDHSINMSGYSMSIEVVDVFNLSPIGLPVL